jgi:hypothetical protein
MSSWVAYFNLIIGVLLVFSIIVHFAGSRHLTSIGVAVHSCVCASLISLGVLQLSGVIPGTHVLSLSWGAMGVEFIFQGMGKITIRQDPGWTKDAKHLFIFLGCIMVLLGGWTFLHLVWEYAGSMVS